MDEGEREERTVWCLRGDLETELFSTEERARAQRRRYLRMFQDVFPENEEQRRFVLVVEEVPLDDTSLALGVVLTHYQNGDDIFAVEPHRARNHQWMDLRNDQRGRWCVIIRGGTREEAERLLRQAMRRATRNGEREIDLDILAEEGEDVYPPRRNRVGTGIGRLARFLDDIDAVP